MTRDPEEGGRLPNAGRRLVRRDAATFDDAHALLRQLPATRSFAAILIVYHSDSTLTPY